MCCSAQVRASYRKRGAIVQVIALLAVIALCSQVLHAESADEDLIVLKWDHEGLGAVTEELRLTASGI